MSNLITEKQKKSVRVEYYIRLVSLSLFLVSLLGLFFLAYVIPYYISVSKKDEKVAEQFKMILSAENKENVGESVSRTIKLTLDQTLAVQTARENGLIPSIYFRKIVENKNVNVKLTELSYLGSEKGQSHFTVSGLARNRDGLVSFIEDLKAKAGFNSVESPVSDFALDKDIAFTLDIKDTI